MSEIIYLDSAASSLKPKSVIDAEVDFLANRYANAGRGICARSVAVDKMVDSARARVAKFINASTDNIVFTSGATDGLNRIVRMISESNLLNENMVAMVSDLDHHSARMPWQRAARRGDVRFAVCPLDSEFNLDICKMPRADVFVITAMSNVLGRAQDVKKIISAARALNPDVVTIVDAAQYIAHRSIDVADWDCDFLCFSAHKIGADTGLGVMYVKEPEKWRPDKFGGGMVARIQAGPSATDDIEWILADGPARFEAGTLPLTQIAGLAPAIDYLESHRPNHRLIKYLHGELSRIKGLTILTKPDDALLTFVVDGMHCLDFGALMGARGVCLRVGNMCATWMYNVLGYAGSIRISVGPWNTMDEMERVADIINKIIK
ncbi:MAG: aminotransferase class V-fold PLP-dependent enzyme [Rickettsiales bacterium]|jgi:cysteine desulfurase/selenocysteine lyase|nr:aminotransferase class V-fold PLP-dependent enzyme [Rickettsiales bacterium]